MKLVSYLTIVPFFLLLVLSSCNKQDDPLSYTEIDDELILEYIADHNLDATATSTGLYYVIENEGVGKNPNINSYVKIKYKGYLTSGKIFDEAKTAVTFPLSNLIKGWQEGIPKFKEGGNGILIVPSHLGYGDRATGEIPANSVLIFEIYLDEVL